MVLTEENMSSGEASQSPDLNPNAMLWHDLKRVIHTRPPKNTAELKPNRCAGLICNNRKRLVEVIFPTCNVNVYMLC